VATAVRVRVTPGALFVCTSTENTERRRADFEAALRRGRADILAGADAHGGGQT
jgi:hypothetical protein